MRYIGSKERLLNKIDDLITEKCIDLETNTFCDLFAGTGCVGRFFKTKFRIISNDYLFFSYCLNVANVKINAIPKFAGLNDLLKGEDVFTYLENSSIPLNVSNNFYITKTYSPYENNQRMYLTIENAKRVDFIRSKIQDWYQEKRLTQDEYYYLIACLVSSVPSYSNVTGTYGAFLKYWDKRCLKPYHMDRINPINNHVNNIVFNDDSNHLIKEISGDILYLDPPYNSREYISNYHLLETIALNDSPEVHGITGTRPFKSKKSNYSIKKKCFESFDELIKTAKFKYIIFSYNSEGILSKDEINTTFKKYCIPSSVVIQELPFSRYQSKKANEKVVYEYLCFGEKKLDLKLNRIKKAKCTKKEIVNTSKFIKSPMNYIGGKGRLLNQLIPMFPSNIDLFIDLFAGGFSVTANVKSSKTISNDLNYKIVDMVKNLVQNNLESTISHIKETILRFGLSKENKENYIKFREYYNETKNPIDLFILSCFSFNYQFRFNNDGQYNNPFGKDRSYYSKTTESKLIAFVNEMRKKDITYSSLDFRQIQLEKYINRKNVFIYCDPPYLITTGSYNDGKRFFGDWLEKDESELFAFLDKANELGFKFALSEVLNRGNRKNTLLLEWAKKYNINAITSNYKNCNYHIGDFDKMEEVLVTNYKNG